MFFKKLKKQKKKKVEEEKKNNIESPMIFVHRDIWAIEGCMRGREPWEDVCLKCGECGRFSK